jgi:hypothetical protein
VPGIFVSYRRADTQAITGRIYDRLEAHFGADSVFIDIDDIPFGQDFREHITNTLDRCDVLLAIIGGRWLGVGKVNRLQDETDLVRIEIEAALAKNIRVVPVLIDRAQMPKLNLLPVTMNKFVYLNAATVDAGKDFRAHIERLIRSLEPYLAERKRQAEEAKQAKLEVERRQHEEEARQPKLEAERKQHEEEAQRAQLEAERNQQEEEARQAKLEAERKRQEKEAQRAKLEAERKRQEEEAQRDKVEAERKQGEEGASRARLEAERKRREQAKLEAAASDWLGAELEKRERAKQQKQEAQAQFKAEMKQMEAARQAKLEIEREHQEEGANG